MHTDFLNVLSKGYGIYECNSHDLQTAWKGKAETRCNFKNRNKMNMTAAGNNMMCPCYGHGLRSSKAGGIIWGITEGRLVFILVSSERI